ncbi:MAG: hypothetical protein APR63_10600 [Desulfuromonas sp. SDB]|nr:MAG: hypothetical protein APR63_10600 [Desulfuromonas sp. SDB]
MNIKSLNLAGDELFLIAAIIAVTSTGVVIRFVKGKQNPPPLIFAPKHFGNYCLKKTLEDRLIPGFTQYDPGLTADAGRDNEVDHNENLVYSSQNIHYNINYPIDINQATQYQLEALPGIGPVIASRIIEYRTSIGRFSCKEDIIGVKGIGPVKFSRIESLITVTDFQNGNPGN